MTLALDRGRVITAARPLRLARRFRALRSVHARVSAHVPRSVWPGMLGGAGGRTDLPLGHRGGGRIVWASWLAGTSDPNPGQCYERIPAGLERPVAGPPRGARALSSAVRRPLTCIPTDAAIRYRFSPDHGSWRASPGLKQRMSTRQVPDSRIAIGITRQISSLCPPWRRHCRLGGDWVNMLQYCSSPALLGTLPSLVVCWIS